MSNITRIDSRGALDAILDEASLWIAKMDRGLSVEETEQFREWLADPSNRDALFEIAKLWDKMDSLSKLADVFPHPVRMPTGALATRFALAASLVLAVLAGSWSLLEISSNRHTGTVALESTQTTYETAVGEQSSITLSDGTQITLNTDSLVSVTYTSQRRLLDLQRGELHVQVAHDPSRPLSVLAEDTVVQAVGTEFNIEITSDQRVELIVTDGRVLVGFSDRNSRQDSANAPALLVESSLAIVESGQQIVLGGPEEEVAELVPDEVAARLAWRDGTLILRGESLEEAVAEIGRYSMVEFVFLDDAVKKVRVAGRFRAGDVDELLSALRENFDITYQRAGENTILLSGR